MPASPTQDAGPAPSRLKVLFRKYGKVAVGVHLSVYACFFAGEAADGAQRRADGVPDGPLFWAPHQASVSPCRRVLHSGRKPPGRPGYAGKVQPALRRAS